MIARKLLDISVPLDTMGGIGDFTVISRALVQDDVEGTSQITDKRWNAPAVREAAQALRDAVMAQSAQQGKPMTF